MRSGGGIAWAVARAIGAALFWVALAQLIFRLTGIEPASIFESDSLGRAAAALAIGLGGLVAYALMSRAASGFATAREIDHD